MQLFYSAEISEENSLFTFNKEESRHIIKVLRKKEGDSLLLTNGKGFLFDAVITIADAKKCIVKIIRVEVKCRHDYHLHIAIAPTTIATIQCSI